MFRISLHFSKRVVLVAIVLIIIVGSLSVWTLLSPRYMIPQSDSSISKSIFQYASEIQLVNLSDSEGNYSFLFGMSYNRNISQGQTMIVDVYSSLVSQHFTTGFMRGVGLHLVDASVLIDGVQIQPKLRMTFRPNILIVYLTSIPVDQNLGNHLLSARLIVTAIDVNYIGYFNGPKQVITLNATMEVV